MTDVATQDQTVVLSTLTAGRRERRFAVAVIAVSSLVFLVVAPLAKVPLPVVPAFIPIYQSALFINDLITAVFLLDQCQFSRRSALSWLAAGYLFTALMSVAHTLTFPGVFSPTGWLGAGPQTTAWLYAFWHGGFPLFVIGYARRQRENVSLGLGSAVLARAGMALAAVCCCALIATAGQDFLPAIMQGSHYTPILIVVVSSIWLINLGALGILSLRRPYSVLDLWLIVTLCAWLFDIALSAGFNAGRYDLGFYAGRIFGLAAASFVLVVLLLEHGKLYAQLLRLRESDRAKAAELERLSVTDALTGIANRRAFEGALGQEWRRMLRHEMPLSLLMIDVDCFKRFNDRYGHVAGDQCLRAVAQAVASRTRRAGELAARYGGEEFAVLLPHSDIGEAAKLAEVICAAVRDCAIPHQDSLAAPWVTVSIGVASIAEVPTVAAALSRDNAAALGTSAATILVETADHALYEAKTSGRNRVVAAGGGDAPRGAAAGAAIAAIAHTAPAA